MGVDQRKARLQDFFKNNLDQLLAIQDRDEQAKYLVGAVEFFFVNVEPTLKDISDAEFKEKEPEVIDLTQSKISE